MTKGKGTKGSTSGKSRTAGSKPKTKTSGSRPSKDAKKSAGAAKRSSVAPKAKPAARLKGGAKAPVTSKKPEKPTAPVTPPQPAVSAPVSAGAPGADAGLIRKKKVKRGAPPMLHNRRLMRRPAPAGAEGAPPKPPTPPGSLHAPARSPEGAEKLKANLTEAINGLARLRALKRNLNRQFWQAALELEKLSSPALYQAKGYGSWESFLEREVERELSIGRTVAADLVKIVKVFKQEAAEEIGLERLRAALKAIWPEPGSPASTPPPGGALS